MAVAQVFLTAAAHLFYVPFYPFIILLYTLCPGVRVALRRPW